MGRALASMERRLGSAMKVLDKKSGKMLSYRQLLRHPDHQAEWSTSSANEFGRLAQGVGGRIDGTNTIHFIRLADIPKERRKDITYGQFVCNIRPEKKEKHRTRFTVGGDRINYPGEVATPTAEMLVAKILFNSVVSTKNAKFMTMDISNFYLQTPLKRPEYIRIKLSDIPAEIIREYKLRDIAGPDGSVYIVAVKGMYGLPQAGLLANKQLEKRLNAAGYHQSKYVPGLWSHKWRPIQFTLVVDDFGVKYVGEEHAKHLKRTLESHYKITTDWTGERYIGINLLWDYKRRRVHLSRREGPRTIRPQSTNEPAALAISERSNPVWRQETIRQAGLHSAACIGKGEEVDSASRRKIFILWPCRRLNTFVPAQRHRLPVGHADHRNAGAHETNP